MSDPGMVKPDEAREQLRQIDAEDIGKHHVSVGYRALLGTVATKPDRLRAAVVTALRSFGEVVGQASSDDDSLDNLTLERIRWEAIDRAAEYENGAPL